MWVLELWIWSYKGICLYWKKSYTAKIESFNGTPILPLENILVRLKCTGNFD